ncbi:MAG TPA: hypothetical protein VFX97_20750 [Pyrinomonadaceae bacterium]|nr:hypothetical protein [Pyrinomonadaceae bacterium]
MNNDLSALADFDDDNFDENAIRNWATETGGLPDESAFPFASWLNGVWNGFDDGSGAQTNEDILKSALGFWTGRS